MALALRPVVDVFVRNSYIQGEITASGSSGSSSSSSSPSSPAQGGSNRGGAIGMPAVTGGLVGVLAATVAFLGGVARVMA